MMMMVMTSQTMGQAFGEMWLGQKLEKASQKQ